MHDTLVQTAVPVSDYAIIVNENDNVAVVKNETVAGLTLLLPDGHSVVLRSSVPDLNSLYSNWLNQFNANLFCTFGYLPPRGRLFPVSVARRELQELDKSCRSGRNYLPPF